MREGLEIAVAGGGPAGLYFAVLAQQANPAHRVTVFERNRAGDTFGFGVVFSEGTMGFLSGQDARSYPEIMAASRRWDAFTVLRGGETVRCRGVGFAAIGRQALLGILQGQARELGVELRFESELAPGAEPPADLVVLADGAGSRHRAVRERELGTSVEPGPTRFCWLGTTRTWDSLTFFFERSEAGVFGVHAYPYADDRSTFIVETDEATWRRAGMDRFSERDTIDYCERLFAAHLGGHRLLSNRSLWTQFRTVRSRRWSSGRAVLIGDAAHTAHFSVGSGTRMAMEDALALVQQLTRLGGDVPAALAAFESERRPRVEQVQRLAAASLDWWAGFRHQLHWTPHRFTFHFLTRSQFRYETLRERDPGFVRRVEAEAGDLTERVCAVGDPGVEPAGLLLAGRAAVSPAGRAAPGERLVAGWAGCLAALRGRTPARIGLQLNHAGARGVSGPLVAASPLAWSPAAETPAALEERGMDEVERDFAAAAAAAAAAGFDWLELQVGHGFLLGSFLSPLTNRRTDAYGGPIERRLRFPLRVLAAAREAWPAGRMLLVAMSAADHAPGGIGADAALAAARAFREAGCDAVTILSGQTTWRSAPPYGRCFNMGLAGRIRNEGGVPTMVVGGITDLDDVRTVLLSGRGDYVRMDAVR